MFGEVAASQCENSVGVGDELSRDGLVQPQGLLGFAAQRWVQVPVYVGAADTHVGANHRVGEGAVVAEVDDVLPGAADQVGGFAGGEKVVAGHRRNGSA